MAWTTIFILIFLLGISYFISRSVLHPAVITAGIWSFILIVYNAFDWELYTLSDDFYSLLLLWVGIYCLAAFIPAILPTPLPRTIAGDVNQNTIQILRPLVIVGLIISLFAIIYRGSLYNSSNIFNGIRLASVATLSGDEDAIPFPTWMKPFLELANIAALPTCLYLLFIKNERSFYTKVVLLLLIIYFVMRSNKNVIAQVGLAFFCLMWINQLVNKKKVFFVTLIFIGLMVALHIVRGAGVRSDEFSLTDFIMQYLLAPLPAFDIVMHESSLIEDFPGEYTFRFFVKIAQKFDPSIVGNSDPLNLHNWTATPIYVNVYTVLFPFYEDFGKEGVAIFALILGYISGNTYRHMRQGFVFSMLVYSCLFYTLIFQFFADNIFQFFGTVISIIIFIALLVFKLPEKI